MSKHTPGPWWLHREHSTVYVEGKARDSRVTQEVAAVGPKEGGREQQEADAKLIATAPDLLRELEHLVRCLGPWIEAGHGLPGVVTLNGARAAIAKAKGETP